MRTLYLTFLTVVLILGCPSSTQAEFFLDLGVGATVFIPKDQDGTWYQEAFSHSFDTHDMGLRAGLGWRFNDHWRMTASYVRLGSVEVISDFVSDFDYDAPSHQCRQQCDDPAHLIARDRVQGLEASVTRTWRPCATTAWPPRREPGTAA